MSIFYEYDFYIPKIDKEAALPQLRAAIEKRMMADTNDSSKFLNNATKLNKGSKLLMRIAGALFILLGIVLILQNFVLGNVMPALPVIGIILIIWGFFNIFYMARKHTDAYTKAATAFLSDQSGEMALRSSVTFGIKEMLIRKYNGGEKRVHYTDVNSVVETEDYFIVFFNEPLIILEKAVLSSDELKTFREFLSEKTNFYSV